VVEAGPERSVARVDPGLLEREEREREVAERVLPLAVLALLHERLQELDAARDRLVRPRLEPPRLEVDRPRELERALERERLRAALLLLRPVEREVGRRERPLLLVEERVHGERALLEAPVPRAGRE